MTLQHADDHVEQVGEGGQDDDADEDGVDVDVDVDVDVENAIGFQDQIADAFGGAEVFADDRADESHADGRCCADRAMSWLDPRHWPSQARRMEIGLATRIMRLRTWMAIAASPACPSSERECSIEPMMCL
jgi:hypothetical protein